MPSVENWGRQARKKRAESQRLFLLKENEQSETCMVYNVLGSTGNVYDISLSVHVDMIQPVETSGDESQSSETEEAVRVADCRWKCSCPDFRKRRVHCKHILFIAMKVLQYDDTSDEDLAAENIWLLANLRYNAPCDARASTSVVSQYESLVKQKNGDTVDGDEPSQHIHKEYVGEDCAICFDEMTKDCQVIFCKDSCQNSVHKDCFAKWYKHNKNDKCVYCRHPIDMVFFGMKSVPSQPSDSPYIRLQVNP